MRFARRSAFGVDVRAGWLGLALVVFNLACEPECERLDSVFAEGFSRPESPPDDVDLIWAGGEGGLSVRSDQRDFELFEPLLDHVFAGTSTVPGMVRWSLVIGLERLLVVEHRVPLEVGERIPVNTLLDDLTFTGGRGTPTWWDSDWGWTEGSTTTARAILTDAFDTELTATAVEGELEIRQTDPLELRAGLSFDRANGATEAYWGEIEFGAAFDFEPCR